MTRSTELMMQREGGKEVEAAEAEAEAELGAGAGVAEGDRGGAGGHGGGGRRVVRVFWDIENEAVPRQCDAGTLVRELRREAERLGAVRGIHVFGDHTRFSKHVRSLTMSGVEIRGCNFQASARRQNKEVADKQIIYESIFWCWDQSTLGHAPVVLIVSSDTDFITAYHELRNRGIDVYICTRPEVTDFQQHVDAEHLISWPGLVQQCMPAGTADVLGWEEHEQPMEREDTGLSGEATTSLEDTGMQGFMYPLPVRVDRSADPRPGIQFSREADEQWQQASRTATLGTQQQPRAHSAEALVDRLVVAVCQHTGSRLNLAQLPLLYQQMFGEGLRDALKRCPGLHSAKVGKELVELLQDDPRVQVQQELGAIYFTPALSNAPASSLSSPALAAASATAAATTDASTVGAHSHYVGGASAGVPNADFGDIPHLDPTGSSTAMPTERAPHTTASSPRWLSRATVVDRIVAAARSLGEPVVNVSQIPLLYETLYHERLRDALKRCPEVQGSKIGGELLQVLHNDPRLKVRREESTIWLLLADQSGNGAR